MKREADGIVKVEKPPMEELESLRHEGAGASRSFHALAPSTRRDIRRTAIQLGLRHKQFADGSMIVYTPPEELLFGVIPFTWEELGLHGDIIKAVREWMPEPLQKPTKVQSFAIPKLLAGYDLVIQGEPGCGKTFAYLLPMMQRAIQRAYGEQFRLPEDSAAAESDSEQEEQAEREEELPEVEDGETAMVYRVEACTGPAGIRVQQRPEELAPFTNCTLYVGDEFIAGDIEGDPLTIQFVEMEDGRGWVPWDRRDLRKRMTLSSMLFKTGQRVTAKTDLTYGSGDVVAKGTMGTVMRVRPLIGVQWDGFQGVKAIDKPRQTLRKVDPSKSDFSWASYAPDTLIITAGRELCEQVASVARQLGQLMPKKVQDEWTVAVAVGKPPGVGKTGKKGNEQWPFPRGDGAPKVLVATLEFLSFFFHKRQVPLWANINCVVYDEVDNMLSGRQEYLLERIKVMFKRAMNVYEDLPPVQSVAVAGVLPSQGTKSPRMLMSNWMPAAMRASERPDLMHRVHPLVQQSWKHVPEAFPAKVKELVAYLDRNSKIVSGQVKGNRSDRPKRVMEEKTLIFCTQPDTAARLAEILATGHNYGEVGLFVGMMGHKMRRDNMQLFREGKIRLMVTTELLERGIDVPDIEHVIQFDFAKNVANHLLRLGRCSRAGTLGHAMNFYDDSESGGRLLAEAIQDLGSRPLDALFSRKGGFKKALKKTERFRQMLLTTGLDLPPHLKEPEPPTAYPMLAEILDELDSDEEEGYFDDAEDSDDRLSLFDDDRGDDSSADANA